MKPTSNEDLECVAKAINRAVYGADAEKRWAGSSEVRDARMREAFAAIKAYKGKRTRAH